MLNRYERWQHCYVAVCNNYAICNTLQTASNCNAVCNISYFKLRCEGNAICNVLQIASKFYHLTRGPKGHISCTWVQCATFVATSWFSDRLEKHKLGSRHWDLASYQVSSNSIQRFQRSSKTKKPFADSMSLTQCKSYLSFNAQT